MNWAQEYFNQVVHNFEVKISVASGTHTKKKQFCGAVLSGSLVTLGFTIPCTTNSVHTLLIFPQMCKQQQFIHENCHTAQPMKDRLPHLPLFWTISGARWADPNTYSPQRKPQKTDKHWSPIPPRNAVDKHTTWKGQTRQKCTRTHAHTNLRSWSDKMAKCLWEEYEV